MSTRTNEQSIRLHTILGKLGIEKEEKEDLVYQITNGRFNSTKALTFLECDALIKGLQAKIPKEVLDYARTDKSDKMRKKIFSICHEIRWTINGKVDTKKLNEYLLKYGYLHKPLKDYEDKELPILITQFENLLKNYYAKR